MTKMDRAADWVATLPPEKSNGGGGARPTRDHRQPPRGAVRRGDPPGRYCWVAGWGWMAYREARTGSGAAPAGSAPTTRRSELARTWLLGTYEAFMGDNPEPCAAKKDWEQQLRDATSGRSSRWRRASSKRDMAEFDCHPDLLNCANCVLDLRTGAKTGPRPGAHVHQDHRGRLRARGRPPGLDQGPDRAAGRGADVVPGPDRAGRHRVHAARRPGPDQHRRRRERQDHGRAGHPARARRLLRAGAGQGAAGGLPGARHGDDGVPGRPDRGPGGDARRGPPEHAAGQAITTPQITGPATCGRTTSSYDTTHATMVNTNHEPAVENADHGSLRRLAAGRVAVPVPEARPAARCSRPTARATRGCGTGSSPGGQGQHEAVLAWMVRGAGKWYEAGRVMPRGARPGAGGHRRVARPGEPDLRLRHRAPGGGRRPLGHVGRAVPVLRQVTEEAATAAWSERTFNARLVSSPRPGGG